MPTSHTDLRIVLNTTITAILEVGTDENDPWREVTDYYRPFWTSPVLPADGILPYVRFEDIGEALAFHRTAIPRGTYSRVPPGDPALSATTRRELARYRKECTSCFYNRQLATDALCGLECLFYGKRGRKYPELVEVGTQNTVVLDLTSSPEIKSTDISAKAPIASSLHRVPTRKKPVVMVPNFPAHVRGAFSRAGEIFAAGTSIKDTIDLDKAVHALDFAKAVAKTHFSATKGNPTAQKLNKLWSNLDFEAVNAPQVASSSASKVLNRSIDDAWASLSFPTDQAESIAATNPQPATAAATSSRPAETDLGIKQETIDSAWANLDFSTSLEGGPMDIDDLEEVIEEFEEVVESGEDSDDPAASTDNEYEDGMNDSEDEDIDEDVSSVAALTKATARYPVEAFKDLKPSWFNAPPAK